jgi:hypothetical protein
MLPPRERSRLNRRWRVRDTSSRREAGACHRACGFASSPPFSAPGSTVGHAKAPVTTPRRAMGHLLGNAIRFGTAGDVMAVGEGIETMLSLCGVLPALPLAAAFSATHLAALRLPPVLRRLHRARQRSRRPARFWATSTTICGSWVPAHWPLRSACSSPRRT